MEPNNLGQTQLVQPTQENGVGPVIAIIIVLAVIILGGLYFWGERQNVQDAGTLSPIEASYETGNADTAVSSIQSQSSSDDTSSIEADLMNTDVNSLDSGL